MSGPVAAHTHDWTTVYELVDRITVNRCRLRDCSAIAVRQWENALHKTTVWPNGDVEIEPTWVRESADLGFSDQAKP